MLRNFKKRLHTIKKQEKILKNNNHTIKKEKLKNSNHTIKKRN